MVEGDEPLSITWSLQAEDLNSGPEIITSQIGSRSSLLMISSITHRHTGKYTCIASNAAGSTSHSSELKVNGKQGLVIGRHNSTIQLMHPFTLFICLEQPTVLPFSFGRDVVNQGEVGQLLCTVVKGDEPLTINWSLQGEELSSGPDLTTSQIGTRTSLLMISSVSYRHTGKYTCTATNAAGSSSISAELKVNGNLSVSDYTGRHFYLKQMIQSLHNFCSILIMKKIRHQQASVTHKYLFWLISFIK